MNVSRLLISLYPAPFRDRYGAALEDEARAQGMRAWPNLIAGAADMWLHPSVWPAESSAQRQRRAITLIAATAAASWYVGHLVNEQGEPLRPDRANAFTVCGLLMAIGFALSAPRPRWRRPALTALAGLAARRLVAPTLLTVLVIVAVRAHPHLLFTDPGRRLLLALWWAAQALFLVQGCRIVAALDVTMAQPPRNRRLYAGIVVLAVAGLLSGSLLIAYAVRAGGFQPLAVGGGVCLLLLTCGPVMAARDLHGIPATD